MIAGRGNEAWDGVGESKRSAARGEENKMSMIDDDLKMITMIVTI